MPGATMKIAMFAADVLRDHPSARTPTKFIRVEIPLMAVAIRTGPKNPVLLVVLRNSHSGDCSNRPSGTTCLGYSDGYIWLVKDSGFPQHTNNGVFETFVSGSGCSYIHQLDTDYVIPLKPDGLSVCFDAASKPYKPKAGNGTFKQ